MLKILGLTTKLIRILLGYYFFLRIKLKRDCLLVNFYTNVIK